MTSFVDKAAQEAASAPVIQGSDEANALLARARAHIYHWPADFAGFSAELVYLDGELRVEGTLTSTESRRIDLSWDREFDTRWVRFQLEELLSHREHPKKSKIASPTGVEMADLCPIYGRKIVFLGDKMGSFYRLAEDRIRQIGRAYQGTEFVINIDRHFDFGTSTDPRYAAADYTAFYWSLADKSLVKTETYGDGYREVGGHRLPEWRQVTIAESQSMITRRLEFKTWKLL